MATEAPVNYDRQKYGRILDWDKKSLLIRGKRVLILSGEFHYWRVPDRSRWRPILEDYKAAGLNAVRIYFHWGYHSPRRGAYIFSGNRDVDFLLRTCEEVGLYVMAAPGPYICAETSAGGFPGWLVAERGVRIRNMWATGIKSLDMKFMDRSREWFDAIIPILARHEITRKEGANGYGVIGLQVENELIQSKFGLTMGLPEEMRLLTAYARAAGCTVPVFSNDAKPWGSWNPGTGPENGVDLYGFDLYLFALEPPLHPAPGTPRSWAGCDKMLRGFAPSVDTLERDIRAFGAGCASGPLFIPELQGGWFCPWTCAGGWDFFYDWFTDEYQRLLFHSLFAQGFSILSVYMFYGGTNAGSLGDPDAFSSYDYSACVREYGLVTRRYRKLRTAALFARSFAPLLLEAEALERGLPAPGAVAPVPGTDPEAAAALGPARADERSGAAFTLARNLSGSRSTLQLEVAAAGWPGAALPLRLPFLRSLLIPANIRSEATHLTLALATLPVLLRGRFGAGELWVVEHAPGGLALVGEAELEPGACAGAALERRGGCSVLTFAAPGAARVRKGPAAPSMMVLCLGEEDALTLSAHFDEAGAIAGVAWGAYHARFERPAPEAPLGLSVSTWGRQRVHLLRPAGPAPPPFAPAPSGPESVAELGAEVAAPPAPPQPGRYAAGAIDWGRVAWRPIHLRSGKDPLEHGFTSGHVLYRCEFQPGASAGLRLRLNVRHYCAVYMNGAFVGSHETYSTSFFHPGAKNGPDPSWLGSHVYDLAPHLAPERPTQTLLIVVGSVGMSRQPVILNDVRNPRGLLSATFLFHNWDPRNVLPRTSPVREARWSIAGVDVTARPAAPGAPDEPYNTDGFDAAWFEAPEPEPEGELRLRPAAGVVRATSSFASPPAGLPVALLVTDAAGGAPPAVVNAAVNGTWLARYVGSMGPQRAFFLPPGLLAAPGAANELALTAFATRECALRLRVVPYEVDPRSGNLAAPHLGPLSASVSGRAPELGPAAEAPPVAPVPFVLATAFFPLS
eukprot:tig00021244_g19584.t1